MPQPKQPPTSPKAPVRGDATAAPAAAKAPGKSIRKAVAKTAAPAARTPAKAAAPKPAKPRRAAARPKAAPGSKAAKPAPKPTRKAAPPVAAPEPTSISARDEALRANLASLRDLLAGGVVLTAQRLQESVDEAVTRGRITRHDAEELATGLLSAGRQQTADLVADLEQLLGRGRSDLTSAREITRGAVKGSSDRVLREVDKARRAAGLGRSFPILAYDELTAAQIRSRLAELTPAELRKVRTHEQRTAARATVLKAIDAVLG